MIFCPDCRSENEHNAPFCLSCGYRFNGEGRKKREGDTLPEGQRNIKRRESQKADLARTQKQNAIQIGKKQRDKETLEEKSPLIEVDESEDGKTFPFIFVVLSLIALVTGLFVFGAFDDEKVELNESKNEVIQIPTGKLLTGLSGEARALFIHACERTKKEGESCEEEVFLAGEIEESERIVEAFRIDKYEVSNLEYQRCVDAGRCGVFEQCQIFTHEGKQFGNHPPKILLNPQHPAVCISQKEASKYCNYKGGQLPSKNEFLRAGREKDRRVFPWGNHWDPTLSNWGERDMIGTPVLGKIDGFGFTSPQGSFPEGCSTFSVCDLSGNLSEWGRKEDGSSVYFSGSWVDSPFDQRLTKERMASKGRTDVGFRCIYH